MGAPALPTTQVAPQDFQALAASRAARARLLAGRYAASREVLLFFAAIARLQGSLAERLPLSKAQPPEHRGFALDQLLDHRSALVELVLKEGPELLREQARHYDEAVCRQSLRKCFTGEDTTSPHSFFARVLLQPVLFGWEQSASGQPGESTRGHTGLRMPPGEMSPQPWQPFEFSEAGSHRSAASCPHCGHRPQAGSLRPQGDGTALSLVCSLCLAQWPFPRPRCPACGQCDPHKIGFYSAAELAHLEVQVCDSCNAYLHLVHLEKEAQAIPDVDELAALPLDVWAREKGYHKVQPNLAGI